MKILSYIKKSKSKYLCRLLMIFILFCCGLFISACSSNDKELEIKIVNTVIEDETFYLEVNNEVSTYSFLNNISISSGYKWKIYKDLEGKEEILSKQTTLNEGNNVYYLIIYLDNEVYKSVLITIRRLPQYKVTFKDGNYSVYKSVYVQENQVVLKPEDDPTKIGYTFDGWDYDFDTLVTKAITVNAQWIPNNYTISFANEDIDSITVTFGEEYQLPKAVKEGNTFNGWYYNGNQIPLQGIWNIPDDVSLNSSMSANTYSINYNPNGGNISYNSQSIEFGSSFVNPTPSKNGYDFIGWYNNNSLVESGIYNFTNNITLDARWELITYDINYYLNGSDDYYIEYSQYNVESSNFTIYNPTRSNYTFVGWTYNGQYLGLINNIVIETGTFGDITLEANWIETDGEYLLLSTAKDLMRVSLNSDLWHEKIKLKNDIDCVGTTIYSIGNHQVPFTGVFEGNDKILKNFTPYINSSYGGLFGYTNGAKINDIKITLSNVNLNSDLINYFGVLIGYSENSLIKNIEVRGNYRLFNSNNGNSTKSIYSGGLIGYNMSEVRNLSFSGNMSFDITQSNYLGINYIGGLIGYNESSLLDSYTTGQIEISTNSRTYIGGLVGSLSGNIVNNYSKMNMFVTLNNTSADVGGLVGSVYVDSIIHNSISLGNIDVNGSSAHVGGIIGNGSSAYISNNYKNLNKTITVNGVSKVTNSVGIFKTEDYLINFVRENWNSDVWQFINNDLPSLKYNKNNVLLEINNKDEFLKLQGQYLIYDYVLKSDIDLTDIEWTPVNIINGTFDGNYKIISNLRITKEMNDAGVFGIVKNSTIQNLAIENAYILFNNFSISRDVSVGILAGKAINSNLKNIYTTGEIGFSNMNASSYAGGIVGQIKDVIYMEGVYSTAFLDASSKNETYVGGLIGYLTAYAELHLNNAYYIGYLNALSGQIEEGGLVGYSNLLGEYYVTKSYYNMNNYQEWGTSIGLRLKTNEIYNFISNNWDNSVWVLSDNENPTFLSRKGRA